MDSPRNDPMLTRFTHTSGAPQAIDRHELTLVASSIGLGERAVRLTASQHGSEQGVRQHRLLDELPPGSHLVCGCDDGTMKGPASSSCFGGRDPMVRSARVGICAGSQMEEWIQRSLWGQRYGLGFQREGDVHLSRDGESLRPAAPRIFGYRRGPNRRGETTAPQGAV
jgi:hypothetical protein